MLIGILALQGGYALHELKMTELGVKTARVISPQDLENVQGLIIPGGESSTMLKIATKELFEKINLFAQDHPVCGLCAGAILMASKVDNPTQACLGLLDISVTRNAYGAQNESFIARIDFEFSAQKQLECLFIRAPKITGMAKIVKVLGRLGENPVLVEQGLHMAATFHPELSEGLEFHRYFLNKIDSA
jgi:pyridoxal 5'-phosphate synthase pdxT subunit